MASNYLKNSNSTVISSAKDGLDAVITKDIISVDDLIKAAKIVAKHEKMGANVKYSAYTGCITGATAVIGGAALTPVGLTAVGLAGGAVFGSFVSLLMFKDKYISLVDIIDELPQNEREKFAAHLREGLKKSNIISITKFLIMLHNSDANLFSILKFLMTTYHSEFFKIVDAIAENQNNASVKNQRNAIAERQNNTVAKYQKNDFAINQNN